MIGVKMKIPHPIPYQGSKRWLAATICELIPPNTNRLFEPFAGSAAVTLAAAARGSAERFVLNDVHAPLMELWRAISERPAELADQYERLWNDQRGREQLFFNEVRAEFNKSHDPAYFLYLLARCVKAAIRYNTKGEFNNSPDNRRLGANPATMRRNILEAARLLRDKTQIRCGDYLESLKDAREEDVIFMDPPYQGVSKERDARYVRGLAFDDFCEGLKQLAHRKLSFIISYDGRTGDREHGKLLPASLGLERIEVLAGRSTQETLLGRRSETYESIYLSSSLLARLDSTPRTAFENAVNRGQLSLFEGVH
ncbi:MAG: DNA adenine methylase [Planctomycetes bacterium]|nr:DNA adenine methylase [Planctomycetota bacterium]